jgi:rhodanese-related sulfurtransferase
MKKAGKTILQITCVIAFSTVLALIVNGIRVEKLPLVAPFPPEYQCPSQMTEGLAVQVEEALSRHGREQILFVDARSGESFDRGHIEGAVSVPYSFLDPVPADAVALLRKSRDIIVYCNTRHAERSRLMAGELSDAGLKGVYYLEGGFLEWVNAQGSYTGQKPEDYE